MSATMFITTAAVPVTRKKAMTGAGSTSARPILNMLPMETKSNHSVNLYSVKLAQIFSVEAKKVTVILVAIQHDDKQYSIIFTLGFGVGNEDRLAG